RNIMPPVNSTARFSPLAASNDAVSSKMTRAKTLRDRAKQSSGPNMALTSASLLPSFGREGRIQGGVEALEPSPDHARAGRDRGDVAGGLVAPRLGDGAERVEEARIEAGAIVDRKVDRAVAEALQHLAEAADAVPPLAPHLLEVDLD